MRHPKMWYDTRCGVMLGVNHYMMWLVNGGTLGVGRLRKSPFERIWVPSQLTSLLPKDHFILLSHFAGHSLDISPPNGYHLLLRLIRFLRTLMKRKPSSKAKHHVTYLLGGDSPLTTEQQQKLRNAMHNKRVRSRPAKKRRRSY